MKAQAYRTGLVFSLAAAVLLGLGCPGPVRKDPFSFYYWHEDGRKIPLVLDSTTLALAFSDATTATQVSAILAGEPLLVDAYEGPVHPLATLAPGASDEEILALIDRLNVTPGVDWANPVVSRDYFAAGIQ